MKEKITYDGLSAEAGQKSQGYIRVLDTDYHMPVTIINGVRKGPTVLITSGVHGGEYPCIETAIQLAAELEPQEISGQLVIIHPVNVQAFRNRVSYVLPEDGKNINRVFPGKKDGSLAEKIAYVISGEFQARADYCFDLHGGDLHEELPPYVYYAGAGPEAVQQKSRELAGFLRAAYLVKSEAAGASVSAAFVHRVPSLLIERGGRGLWSKEEVEDYKADIKNLLRYVGLLAGKARLPEQKAIELSGASTPLSSEEGCWHPAVKLGEQVEKGQKLGEVRNLFGAKVEEIFAPIGGVVIYMAVSLAINKGDPLLSLGFE